MSAALALRQAGIGSVVILEKEGPDHVGAWSSIARMKTLRTDRDISGPELFNEELSFRRWYIAGHGIEAYERIDFIDLEDWRDYLLWFRKQTSPDIRHGTSLVSVMPGDGHLVLNIDTGDGPATMTASRLVVASGLDGFGSKYVPPILQDGAAPGRLFHTQDPISFADMRDRRVLVVGGASSAFDAASTALEHGATRVDQIVRGDTLAPDAPRGAFRHAAIERRFSYELSDEARWAQVMRSRARGNAPAHSVARAGKFPNYRLHLGQPVTAFSWRGEVARLPLAGEVSEFDYVIAATGYRQGAQLRPEFSHLASFVRTWRGVAESPTPEAGHWQDLPYLGRGFELTPLSDQETWVSRIHVLTFAAFLNHGIPVGDIGSAALAVPRLVEAIGRHFFEDQKPEAERKAIFGPPSVERQEAVA
jgi:cation diffusion facilitator CzcD-associated flavoprotein CzcO